MGNSSSRQQSLRPTRDPDQSSRMTQLPPNSTVSPHADDATDRSSRIRPRSVHQQQLLQEPWPPQTRPSQPSLTRRRTRISRYLDELAPTFSRRDRSPRRRNRLSQIFHPHADLTLPEPGPAPRTDHDDSEMPQLDLDNGPRFDLNFASASGSALRPRRSDEPENRVSPASLADRISSLTPARELSRLRTSRRRNRAARNRQDSSMSNILTLAAHALAATLTGNNSHSAVEDLRRAASSVDPDDGSLDAFMQFLQSGRLSSHLARSMAAADERDEEGLTTESQPPLDFFRMFQLRNTLRPAGADSPIPSDRAAPDSDEGRMVPILIVGIRSLHHHDAPQAPPERPETNAVPHFIDTLTRAQSEGDARDRDSGSFGEGSTSQRPRWSTSRNRRASLNALHSSTPEGRRQQWITDIGRPRSEVGFPTTSSTPLGPSPPPTTPASAPLSALSSGVTTPSNRASMSETGSSPDQRETLLRTSRRHSLLSRSPRQERSPSPVHRRAGRRGNGIDFLRHGSGSARRRGIVGPAAPPPEGNRSWIIYVLGGNYPENHPILSTPSLFTDSPTYEDMLLLSSLIGPAKPPVASQEEVAAAGGLYNIRLVDGALQATPEDAAASVLVIDSAQTCGICLMSYSQDEVTRRLQACNHMYHRECVDEWLTTGRNSCPLCRVKGVDDKTPDAGLDTGAGEETPLDPIGTTLAD